MAKGFTTIRLFGGQEPVLRRLVSEISFRDGYLYLDHTGRFLRQLTKDPAWVVATNPNTQGTTVFHIVYGFRLAFTHRSVVLDFDRSDATEAIDEVESKNFCGWAESLFGQVIDEFEVEEYERFGFRKWYHFGFEGKVEAEGWIAGLGLFLVSPQLRNAYMASLDAVGCSMILKSEACYYRIGINGVERAAQLPIGDQNLNIRASALSEKQEKAFLAAQKARRQRHLNSMFAAIIDIDAYIKNPEHLNVADFLNEHLDSDLEQLRLAIATSHEEGK